jgi:hypothetical protein
MLKCSECETDINIKNKIYRCFDGTVCSYICQNNRYLKIKSKDKTGNNYNLWENSTYYLIDPKKTIKQMLKSPSFVPIYINNRSELKKTISNYILDNYNLDNFNDIKDYKIKDNSYNYYEKNYDLNNYVEQNLFLENMGNLSIFDRNLLDLSYNLLYVGANKLYNIINRII